MNTPLAMHDKEQRQLALNATQSFIIQAPAGSGKTELLIQRFLLLLSQVSSPEEILAITFTKKAANEMRTRIIKALKQAEEAEPASEHAKLTWSLAKKVLQQDRKYQWHLTENPNQLRIQTIDALCTYLTNQLPILSTFGSPPEIADNPYPLYREAAQEVLQHVEENFEWSQSISRLLVHLDNDLNKLLELIINLLAKRDQWLPYIHLNSNDVQIRHELEKQIKWVIADRLRALAHIFPKEISSELLFIGQFAAANLDSQQIESPINSLKDLSSLPGDRIEDFKAWLAIGKLLLTEDCTWRKSFTKKIGFPALSEFKNPTEKAEHKAIRERFSALLSLMEERDDLRHAFADIFSLPHPYYQADQWTVLQAILQLLKIAAAQLRVVFQLYGKIDFIENSQAALTALGCDEQPTDLTLALDYQIKHILVDEFQDTSFTQFQLLEKLVTGWQPGDGRTLFVVGDPMQSIYRFREAEVGLFIRMRDSGICNVKLTPLTLSLNFRSTSSIVEWNNIHFKSIFPSYTDIATGAVTYSESVASNLTTQKDSIEISGFLINEDKLQADQVVKAVISTKQHYPDDSVAILVRSRSHLRAIIPALKKANIAYRAIDIDPLTSRQCIIDLLSLTSALLHPADRIAWLAILRAPWCGLTLSDLLIIAEDHQSIAIWERINDERVLEQLSQDGRNRLTRILPILNNQLAERERQDLRSWIENTWLLLGGPACLANELELDDCAAFFALLNKINQQQLSLNIETLKEKIEHLYATTKLNDDSVQIMTIHTAKGLEFDTVILPHLERSLPHDDKPLLAWIEQPLANNKTALLLAPINAIDGPDDALYQYIQECQKMKSDHEINRLFYVATTRAKKRLRLLFNTQLNANNELKINSGSFLSKLWPVIKQDKQHIISDLPSSSLSSEAIYEKSIRRLHASWINPLPMMLVSSPAIHQQQKGFQLKNHTPQCIGIVIHKILQHIAMKGTTWWEEMPQSQQLAIMKRQLVQAGLFTEQLFEAIEWVQKAIHNTLTDTQGQWILANHSEARSELPLSVVIDGHVKNIVIDRTFIDENNIRWIIDFKTATFSHAELGAFLKKEQEKHLEQMQIYKHAISQLDERPIRLGLYFPAIPAWHVY